MVAFAQLTQRLLVLNENPSAVSPAALLCEIVNRRPHLYPLRKFRAAQAALTSSADVALLRVPSALSASTCAMMRQAIDEHGYGATDATDGLLNHELVLSQVRVVRCRTSPRVTSCCVTGPQYPYVACARLLRRVLPGAVPWPLIARPAMS